VRSDFFQPPGRLAVTGDTVLTAMKTGFPLATPGCPAAIKERI